MDLLDILCCLKQVSHIVIFFFLEEKRRKKRSTMDIANGINIYVVNWIKLTINSLSWKRRESWEQKKLTVDYNQ